jgi:hypothetical protein
MAKLVDKKKTKVLPKSLSLQLVLKVQLLDYLKEEKNLKQVTAFSRFCQKVI